MIISKISIRTYKTKAFTIAPDVNFTNNEIRNKTRLKKIIYLADFA